MLLLAPIASLLALIQPIQKLGCEIAKNDGGPYLVNTAMASLDGNVPARTKLSVVSKAISLSS